MSFEINGYQINIQTAIVGDLLIYSHYYEIQVNFFGSDLNDNTTFNSSCIPNPCENGGTCQIGLSEEHFCSCPSGYIGKKSYLNVNNKLIDLIY